MASVSDWECVAESLFEISAFSTQISNHVVSMRLVFERKHTDIESTAFLRNSDQDPFTVRLHNLDVVPGLRESLQKKLL